MFDPVITDLESWLKALTHASALIEIATLATCVLVAWWLTGLVARAFEGRPANSIMFGRKLVDGVLFPALMLCLAFLARKLLGQVVPLAVFRLVIPVFLSLLVIRLGVKVLQAAFPQSGWVRPLERTISWLAWLIMVLWVSGLLPVVLNELDQIGWKVGNSHLTLRNMLEGAVTAGAVLIFTLWLSAGIETRVLRNATGGELSLRKAISNAARAVLMFVGLIIALSSVGIDLTALSVLGGAVGVGIGLGLQKLAANYVSGFVILAERSMRIGDNVRVDGFEGLITQINARYTVIRSLTGRESIVPNEMLIINRVENLSLADSRVYQSTVVSVGYESDVTQVQALLLQAALDQPRVLHEPGPIIQLSNLAADGLEFTVGNWIADPLDGRGVRQVVGIPGERALDLEVGEVGQGGLKSDINLAILAALRANQIDIPYPQRVVHQR